MPSEWYVARDGERFGPFTSDEMSAGVRNGELRREDFVWHAGLAEWQRAKDVPGLWASLEPSVFTLPIPPERQFSILDERQDYAQLATTPSRIGQGLAIAKSGLALAKKGGPLAKKGFVLAKRGIVAAYWAARLLPGFVVRHWGGELTLTQAYWGVGMGLTLFVVALSYAFGEWMGNANLSPVGIGLALVSFLSFLCVVTVWQLLGIWRAAGHQMVTPGRRPVWGVLARVAVVLGVIRAVADFSTVIWPMLFESAILASGRDNTPAHQLRLLRNGTEVELAGGMPFGTADALKQLLDAAPGVKVVHLNSIGGRVGEGYQIYQIVRDRKLATYTATDCVSACTIAFLGGSQRYLSSKARLGFHSISFGGVDQKQLPDINADLRRMLAAHGAPPWFIEKAVSTGADSMWYPPSKDLLAAKIVTQIVDPDQFGMSGIVNWRDREALERGLLTMPFYVAVRDNDPEGFKKISNKLADAMRLGKSQPEMIRDVQEVFGVDILPKYLQVAPNAAIQRYWRTQIAEMEYLSKGDPALCVQFSFPELRREGFNVGKVIPAALVSDDIAALTELIEQAVRTPQKEKPGNVDAELIGVIARISTRVPNAQQVLAEPAKYAGDPRTLCAAVLAYYKEIVNLPPARSGRVLRAMAEPSR
jgi:hypothetical protein